MNVIFTIVVLCSMIFLTIYNPDGILSAMLSGGQKALTLTLKLVVVYAVWMGIFKLLELSGLSKKIAKLLKPLNKFLFGKVSDEANEYMSLNMSANLLGMSGATTPMGIKGIETLYKNNDGQYAITMFFVINATSIQIIPSSVLALRSEMGSTNPSDIILPTILSTLVSTIVGVLLVKIFVRNKNV